MSPENLKTALYVNFVLCKVDDLNQKLLDIEYDQLVVRLRAYSIIHSNDETINQLLALHNSIQIVNNSEINNKEPIRALTLIYYKLLKKYLSDVCILIENIKKSQFKTYIDNLENSEIENYFEDAIRALRPESNNNHVNNITTILRNVAIIPPDKVSFVDELDQHCKSGHNVLLYPSSGIDTCDIRCFDQFYNNVLTEHTVFIHVDYYADINNIYLTHLFPNASLTQACFETNFEEGSLVNIIKISDRDKIYWLVIFSKTRNEQLLRLLIINNSIRVDTLFCKCDGITSGMGVAGFSIPTPLYICFHDILKLKRIITEYGVEYLATQDRQWWQEKIHYFRQWLTQNLTQEMATPILESMAEKSISDIVVELGDEALMNEAYNPECLCQDTGEFDRNFYLVTIK